MIISPCISICKTDPLTGFCYGCGRNEEDKKKWKDPNTSDQWKKNNLIISKEYFEKVAKDEIDNYIDKHHIISILWFTNN